MNDSASTNLLLEDIEYQISETGFGQWRRYVYPNGRLFEEFKSHNRFFGLPLIHFTRGKCPETGKLVVAKGCIAVGRLACGGLAIGHASAGIIAVGQASFGALFGLGQLTGGVFALGQAAFGIVVGIGQFATGYTAVGQLGLGKFVLAQLGFGEFVWDTRSVSPVAKEFFRPLLYKFGIEV